MLFTPIKKTGKRGLGNIVLPPLDLSNLDIQIDSDLLKESYEKWRNNLTEEDKRVLEENAEVIRQQMENGTFEERDADYYLRNPVVTSDRVEPLPGTPTYIRENGSTASTTTSSNTTSSNTTTNTSTAKQNSVATTTNTANTATPKTAESKKWIPGLENWQTGAIAGLAAISLVTVVVIATSSDDKKKKKKKRK